MSNHHEQIKIQQLISNYLDKSTSIEGVRILTIPKETINGDFYVVIRSGHSIYLLIADGAGHGLSAVMPGLQFPNIFVELANKDYSIVSIASQLNAELYKDNHKGYFIALTLVQINEYEGFIEVLNCGNPSALLISENGTVSHKFHSKSLACGIVDNDNYDLLTERIQYKDPSRLYVFTDGLPDTLIQGGICQDSADHESLYAGKEASKCFDKICSYVEQVNFNGKVDDITLVEVSVKTTTKPAVTISKQQDIVSELDIKGALSTYRVLCIDPDKSSLR